MGLKTPHTEHGGSKPPQQGWKPPQQGWYRYGVMFIAFEALIAILQTTYAVYMVLTGAGGPGGGH